VPAAVPETTTTGGSSARDAWLACITRLSVVVLLAFVALAALTARADAAGQITVLAADDGLQLLGPLHALPQATPELDDLSRVAARRLGRMPAGRVFLRGAVVSGREKYAARLTLVMSLPKALFAGTRLTVYRLNGRVWRRIAQPAVVGLRNTTAGATITRPGRYAVFLGPMWRTIRQDGYRLVRFFGRIPWTVLRKPAVLASGKTGDPALIAAVARAGGRDEEWARSTLRSYDTSGDRTVRVIRLRRPMVLVRDSSDTSSVGRWFSPYRGTLYTPIRARILFGLPRDNLATSVTLHRLKRGAVLIQGTCADMTWDPVHYWPYATGGGRQLFGPKVSTYPPPVYDGRFIETVSDLRWEASELDAVVW
jgi:hypothetical protein